MQLGGDEVEPLLQLVALGAVAGGREVLAGGFIRNHLDNDRAFGQEFAIVHAKRRHLAFWIDLQVVVAVLELLRPQIDLDQIVWKTGFQQRDMGRKRTGSGRII